MLSSGCCSVPSLFDFTLVNLTTGRPCPCTRRQYRNFSGEGLVKSLSPPGKSDPPPESFGREVFESPSHLRDDRVAVRFEVTVISNPRVSRSRLLPYIEPPPPGRLSKELGRLLESGAGADVAFHVGEEVHAAPRAVLAARSPVFRAELLGPTEESASGRVVVEDMQPAVFRALLGFVYTVALPPAVEDLDDVDDRTEMLRHLLVAADRYAVEGLRQLCESALCRDLAASTARTTLALAEQHRCDRLRSACVEFLDGAAPDSKRRRKTAEPSSSSCTVETSRGAHVFHVHQYGLFKALVGTSKHVQSGAFDVGGYYWAIFVYPSGFQSPEEGVAVCPVMAWYPDSLIMVPASFDFTLVDQTTGRPCPSTIWH